MAKSADKQKDEDRELIRTVEVGDVTVIHTLVPKIIDDHNIKQWGLQLFDLVETQGRTKLLVNFSSIQFISSAGLGKLVILGKKVKANGGALRLCGIIPQIYEVFALTRLNRLFIIADDEEAALASF